LEPGHVCIGNDEKGLLRCSVAGSLSVETTEYLNAKNANPIFCDLSNALSAIGAAVLVKGDGATVFLVGSLGSLSVEFYLGDGGFIVDPAINDDLQGERSFESY